jgi:UV DNA damage endonuclease
VLAHRPSVANFELAFAPHRRLQVTARKLACSALVSPHPATAASIGPRLGFCCRFVPPDGDRETKRRMNLTSTTIAALGRRERTEAFARLLEIVRHNMSALQAQLAWVAARPPLERLLRIESGVLPAYTHELARWMYREPAMREVVEDGLAQAGAIARQADIRLSMHPGQFCVLATTSGTALRNCIEELEYHAEVMALLGVAGGWHPAGAHINIHGGAKAAGLEAFRHGLELLSNDARGLLTVENDEDVYGLDALLSLADALPIVVDLYHHWIASAGEYLRPDDPRVARVRESWRGIRPIAHLSQPREDLLAPYPSGARPDYAALIACGIKRRDLYAHSDTMWNDAVNIWAVEHLAWTDLEVEAKLKNLASARLAAAVESVTGPIRIASL